MIEPGFLRTLATSRISTLNINGASVSSAALEQLRGLNFFRIWNIEQGREAALISVWNWCAWSSIPALRCAGSRSC
jgi:hypothetical protein